MSSGYINTIEDTHRLAKKNNGWYGFYQGFYVAISGFIYVCGYFAQFKNTF